jgi:hypothetical protein
MWIALAGLSSARVRRPAMAVDEDLVRSIAEAIENYLRSHPDAADSSEGIHRWWLPERLTQAQPESVVAALERLISTGVVRRNEVGGGGAVLYSLGLPRRRDTQH